MVGVVVERGGRGGRGGGGRGVVGVVMGEGL